MAWQVNVPLNLLVDNLYQPRQEEDPEHIRELAESIKAEGLLQVPAGRLLHPDTRNWMPLDEALEMAGVKPVEVTEETWRYLFQKGVTVQLAFGHSRAKAIRTLRAESCWNHDGMPVNILDMDDQSMFRAAITENLARKDLTPIEEAAAMQRAREELGMTSEAVGALFGVSDSAVRGKVRLLNLPENFKTSLAAGKMSEGAAREVLAVLDMPENVAKQNPIQEALNAAAEGSITAEKLRDTVGRVLSWGGDILDMSKAEWKWDQPFEGENIRSAQCKGCPLMFQHDKKTFCTDRVCFIAKERAVRLAYLEKASAVSGVPIFSKDDSSEAAAHPSYDMGSQFGYDFKVTERIIQSRCENLRLVYDHYNNDGHSQKPEYVDGFPAAKILCQKRNGFCTCMKAKQEGVEIEPGEDGVTEEQLKAARLEIMERKRRYGQVNNDLRERAVLALTDAMLEDRAEVWKLIANRVGIYPGSKDNAAKQWRQMIAEKVFDNNVFSITWESQPQKYLDTVNQFLREAAGLPGFDFTFAEEEDEPAAETAPQGKTLIEVFAEEEAEE